jgi:hypothetical protein
MKQALVTINDDEIILPVEGETIFGADETLLLQDDDVTNAAAWNVKGFTVEPLLAINEFEIVKSYITQLVSTFIQNETKRPVADFTLEKYHEFCADNELHLKVVKNFQQCLPIENFPINFTKLDERISVLCGADVTCNHPTQEASRMFCIRIVRPQRNTDNNPPHRDVWLQRLRNAVNIYLPLAGSNEKSSLPLIPGSHFWKESDIERTAHGAKVNNVAFTVPCVVGSTYGLNMIRPQVNENEVMVFSPYLIHGGGCNLNKDVTRVSIEIRFWRKP